MSKKSVAVLDVHSSKVCAVVGEKGVNNTFIIKAEYSCDYDGYQDGEWFSTKSFQSAVKNVVSKLFDIFGNLKVVYVGVPSEFLKVKNIDGSISFKVAKKITQKDLNELSNSIQPDVDDGYATIRHSCLYYVLSDKKKTVNPIGAFSDSLHGKFAFYRCKDNFDSAVDEVFNKLPFKCRAEYIPIVYAQAMYLIEPELRDEYAVLFDLGYMSSSYSVVCGNGLAYCEHFSIGIGHVAKPLMEVLKIPFELALIILTKVNLNAIEADKSKLEIQFKEKIYAFSIPALQELIRSGLDGICINIEECMRNYDGRNVDGKTLLITGDSVKVIKGMAEHISFKLDKNYEIISPKVPFYDKPEFSSLFSLLNITLNGVDQ